MDVDRPDLYVLFEGVIVEQSRASTKLGHTDLARGTRRPTLGTRIPAQDGFARLFS